MRKFVLIGFLALLFYQIIGFFTFIEIEHYLIRKEIKRAIKLAVPENQLIDFHFTSKENRQLNWVKPHEFRLNGRYYDVVHKRKSNGIWHFKCIDDIQETALFEKLAFATADNLVNSPDHHPVHGWIKLINEPMETLEEFNFCLVSQERIYSTEEIPYSFVDSNPNISILSPPPEFDV